MEELVGKVYGEALFKLAVEENKLDVFYKDLENISKTMDSDKEINTILSHPKISTTDKKDLLKNLFGGNVDKDIMNFLNLAVDKKRERDINSIFKHFKEDYNQKMGIIEGIIYTTNELNKEEINELEDILSKKYDKKVKLENIIDESVIGGVKLDLSGTIIDNSISGALNDLKKILKEQTRWVSKDEFKTRRN